MKATYKVIRNEDNKVISRLFVIEDNDREALLFIAERLNLFNTDLVANDTLYAYVFDSYTGTVAAMKELFRKEYNAAKEALKASKEQAPAPAMMDTEQAPAPAKVKKVRRRNRQMVKALKYCGHMQNRYDITCEAIKRGEKNGIVSGFFLSYKRLKARKEKTMKRIARRGWSIFEIFFTPFYNVA